MREENIIRLLTYNVHSCLGTDGKRDPTRIAAVIAEYEPDIVALQELDDGKRRSQHLHQARLIASHLSMDFHFHAAMHVEEERYGDAILSRWPMRVRHAAHLPTVRAWLAFERRGAIWATVETPAGPLQVINTHLGLSGKEREVQIAALLGPEWLGHPDCRRPVVLCGDFNAMMRSPLIDTVVSAGYRHAARGLPGQNVQATFPSLRPFMTLDHAFASPEVKVKKVEAPRTALTRVASDHLPVVVDLELPVMAVLT